MNELYKIRNEIRMGTRLFQNEAYMVNDYPNTIKVVDDDEKPKDKDEIKKVKLIKEK